MGQNEGELLDFLDIMGWNYRAIQLGTYTILKDKEQMSPKEIPRSTGLPLQFQGGCGEPGALVSDSSCTDDSGRQKLWGWSHARLEGQDPPHCQICGGRTTDSVGMEGRASYQRGLCLKLNI